MAVDLSKHDFGRGRDGIKTGDYLGEGQYRFLIQHAEMAYTNGGDELWKLDCEVVAGNPGGHEGKQQKLSFFTKDGQYEGNEGRLLILSLATGIVTLEQLRGLQAAGKGYEPDLTQAIGREFCAELRKDKNGYLRIKGSNIWAVTDEEAKEIPGCGPNAAPAGAARQAGNGGGQYVGAF